MARDIEIFIKEIDNPPEKGWWELWESGRTDNWKLFPRQASLVSGQALLHLKSKTVRWPLGRISTKDAQRQGNS
jgi:hypothetical protein